jgi:hypothetical protein
MAKHFSLLFLILAATATAASINVTVPGTSDPWLAGMPPGSTASITDSAPAESPVFVALTVVPGEILNFSATGGVSNVPGCDPMTMSGCFPPDGGGLITHATGAENGIADVNAPLNALLGIFLDNSQPSLTAAPAALDFGTIGLNFTTFAPGVKQVFFIGDGKTNTNVTQDFVVPAGATRLFLGTMDGFQWANNSGAFDVNVTTATSVPEPGSWLMIAGGILVFVLRRKSTIRSRSED